MEMTGSQSSQSPPTRLDRQIRFLMELDRLKGVLRQSITGDGLRRENSAEHSWHVTMAALILHEYANEAIDLTRVFKMLLIHDIVEIDAGDTFIYDEQAQASRPQREREAAQRIFGLLPPDQGEELKQLWEEFETGNTPEARFAAALDRLQAVLQNFHTQGLSWRRNGVTSRQVLARNKTIADGSEQLWQFIRGVIEAAVKDGYLKY